jgi:hypothetical protein
MELILLVIRREPFNALAAEHRVQYDTDPKRKDEDDKFREHRVAVKDAGQPHFFISQGTFLFFRKSQLLKHK